MGNDSLNKEHYDIIKNYHRTDWIPLPHHSQQQLWRNKHTHQTASVYKLYQYPSIDDLRRFQSRSLQQELVKVLHIALEDNFGICVNQPYVHLLIQYMPICLETVANIDFQEGLTILVSVLKGFDFMEANFGPIEPSQQLIGLNQLGKAKVWLNQQHNINYPQEYHLSKNSTQQDRVLKIFNLIQKCMINHTFPQAFRQEFLYRKMAYKDSIAFVQEFAFINQLSLKRYLRMDLALRRSEVKCSSHMSYTNPNPQVVMNNSPSSTFVHHSRGNSTMNKQSYIHIINQPPLSPQPLKRMSSHGSLLKQSQPTIRHHDNNLSMLNIRKQSFILQTPQLNNKQPLHHPKVNWIPRISFNNNNQPVQYISNSYSTFRKRESQSPVMNISNNMVEMTKKPLHYGHLQAESEHHHISRPDNIIFQENDMRKLQVNVQNRQVNHHIQPQRQLQRQQTLNLNPNPIPSLRKEIELTFNPTQNMPKNLPTKAQQIIVSSEQFLASQILIKIKSDDHPVVHQQKTVEIFQPNQQSIHQPQQQSGNEDHQNKLHSPNSIIEQVNFDNNFQCKVQVSEYQSSEEINPPFPEQQDFKTSGTFQLIDKTDSQNLQPLNYIYKEEQQNPQFNRYDEHNNYQQQEEEGLYYNQSEIIQEIHHNEHQDIPQMPINFESFAGDTIKDRHIFVSFAPIMNNIDENVEEYQNIHAVQTTKNLQYGEKGAKIEELVSYNSIVEQSSSKRFDQFKMISLEKEQEEGEDYEEQDEGYYEEPYRDHSLEPNSQISPSKPIQIHNTEQQRRDSFENEDISIKKFYDNYTPVESRLDIINRNSIQSRSSDKLSVFNQFQDTKIQNYIRSKYNLNENTTLNLEQDVQHVDRLKIISVHSIVQQDNHNKLSQDIQDNHKTSIVSLKNNKNRPIKISNITQKSQEDFLDVNFLEKSLDSKYNSIMKMKSPKQKEKEQKEEQDDLFNVAKLQQGLIKFSNSKISVKNTQKNNTERSLEDINLVSSYKEDKLSSSIKKQHKEPSIFKKFQEQKEQRAADQQRITFSPAILNHQSKEIKLNKQNIQQSKRYKDNLSKLQLSTGFQYTSTKDKKKKSVQIDYLPTEEYKYQLSYTGSSGFGHKQKYKTHDVQFSFRKNPYQQPYNISTQKHTYNDYKTSKNDYVLGDEYSSVISPIRKTLGYKKRQQTDKIEEKYRKYVQKDRKNKFQQVQKAENTRNLSKKQSFVYKTQQNDYPQDFNANSYLKRTGNSYSRDNLITANQASNYRIDSKLNLSPIRPKIKDLGIIQSSSGPHLSYEHLRSFLLG